MSSAELSCDSATMADWNPEFQQPTPPEKITMSHAVVIRKIETITDPDPVEYAKAVADIVGAQNVHSVCHISGKYKVYLKKQRDVETVVSSGVKIRGLQTQVEYAVPVGTKVLITEVDSFITNKALYSALLPYGKILSCITVTKIPTSDVYYSHVESDVRQVYMDLNCDANIPGWVEFISEGVQCKVFIQVETSGEEPTQSSRKWSIPCTPSTSHSGPKIVNVTTVKRTKPMSNKIKQYRNTTKWKYPRPSPITDQRLSIQSMSHKKLQGSQAINEAAEPAEVHENEMSVDDVNVSSSNFNVNNMDANSNHSEIFVKSEGVSQYPLSYDKLQEFIRMTKSERELKVKELAEKMLGENNMNEVQSLKRFRDLNYQLEKYLDGVSDVSLRQRVKRLTNFVKGWDQNLQTDTVPEHATPSAPPSNNIQYQ